MVAWVALMFSAVVLICFWQMERVYASTVRDLTKERDEYKAETKQLRQVIAPSLRYSERLAQMTTPEEVYEPRKPLIRQRIQSWRKAARDLQAKFNTPQKIKDNLTSAVQGETHAQ